jgi:hypothetical protein
MAGTVTKTELPTRPSSSNVREIRWTWTSDASGDADLVTTEKYSGRVRQVVTNPDGAAAPTDNYDIVVNDADGNDVLGAQGANRDTANTEIVTDNAAFLFLHNTTLNLVVSNAGNAKAGVVVLLVGDVI